jgi:hypothetical protein
MKFIKYIIFIIIISITTSCEKEIDFEYHDIPRQQVIEGLITREGVSVRLTETVATDEPFTDDTVTDADVTLTDITADIAYTLTPGADGAFTLSGLKGEPGHTYELTVNRDGKSYTSTSTMLPPTEIISAEFNWIKMPYDDVAVLKVQFRQDADPETRYWMRVYRNGEPYEWQAISSHNGVDGVVRGMLMTSRKDTDEEDENSVLVDGDLVEIEIMPISKVMADYLDSLNNGDYNGNRMFEGDYCLGYFLAAPMATTSIVYHPDDIPYAE